MNEPKMIVQVLKENVSGRMFFVTVTKPMQLNKAQQYQKSFENQYPNNTYRIVDENDGGVK